jgi:hypothetical protein
MNIAHGRALCGGRRSFVAELSIVRLCSSRAFAMRPLKLATRRYGSKADIGAPSADVRFTPKSGHGLAQS